MKSVGWLWKGPGEPGSLVLENVEIDEPGSFEVCVENRMIAFNPVDWKLIESGHPAWRTDGHIPGVDAMGIIVARGSGVHGLEVGQRVAYHTDLRGSGSFAGHCTVPARAVLRVPDGVSDELAAGFPCPGLTAWLSFSKLPELRDEAVLIAGAGSNVGRYAVTLARRSGARVFASAGPGHHDGLRSQGVVGVADYHQKDWVEQLLSDNGGEPFHAIIDLVSSEQATQLVRHVGYSGHLVAVLGRADGSFWPPFSRCVSLHEVALGAQHEHGSDRQWQRMVSAGEQMLFDLAKGLFPRPETVIGEFEQLPVWLARYREEGQGRKYLVATAS